MAGVTREQGRDPRPVAGHGAVAVNDDPYGHRAGAEGAAIAMIGVGDGHEVAEAQPVEPEAADDLGIEQLDVAVAEMGVVAAEAGSHDGGGDEMRHRRHQPMALGPQAPAAQQPHRAVHDGGLGMLEQPQALPAGINLDPISDLEPARDRRREIDQDMIDAAMLARDASTP